MIANMWINNTSLQNSWFGVCYDKIKQSFGCISYTSRFQNQILRAKTSIMSAKSLPSLGSLARSNILQLKSPQTKTLSDLAVANSSRLCINFSGSHIDFAHQWRTFFRWARLSVLWTTGACSKGIFPLGNPKSKSLRQLMLSQLRENYFLKTYW